MYKFNDTCTNSTVHVQIQRYMYKFKYREIHHSLTGELTVVHVRRFINFLTSEFGSSTRGERDTILKSLSYHTKLTKLKRSAHLVEF